MAALAPLAHGSDARRVTRAPIVLLLHGPNLNLLGEREPEVYGTATLDDHVATARAAADAARPRRRAPPVATTRASWSTPSTRARGRCAAIVINPGAFTHYAWAIHDALAAFDGPIVELHLSNPNAREPWRHTSVVAPVATGIDRRLRRPRLPSWPSTPSPTLLGIDGRRRDRRRPLAAATAATRPTARPASRGPARASGSTALLVSRPRRTSAG